VFNLLVGLLLSLSAVAQPAFLKEGLIAYYPITNGFLADGVAMSKVTGQVGFEKDRFGKDNQAVSLKGGFFEIEPVDFFGKPNPHSVSFWFRRNDNSAAAYLITRAGWAMGPSFGILDNYNTKNSLNVYTSKQDPFLDSSIIENNKWTQVCVVYNLDSASLYINGILNGERQPFQYNDNYNVNQIRVGATVLYDGSPIQPFLGAIDDLRIYNRALSDTEVKALYDYESIPRQINPRIATATAQVVNGFVVGATITDAGYGYESNPVVTITGGGGTGAKATATQFNGVVTSITITNPGSGYTSTPTITIAPPPFPPRKATSTAQIVNGFVVGTKITDGGFGYDSPPTVLLVGGGGSGATAVATVANGVVTAITISNPGTGYTSAPVVRIASPPFAPKLGIETSKVYVRMSVVLGRKYQLEASTDLNTWTSTGPSFIAQDEELVQEFDVNQVGRYFRINQVP
jgi:hypothetical protein